MMRTTRKDATLRISAMVYHQLGSSMSMVQAWIGGLIGGMYMKIEYMLVRCEVCWWLSGWSVEWNRGYVDERTMAILKRPGIGGKEVWRSFLTTYHAVDGETKCSVYGSH
jgi:hypothetical protein